MTRAVCLGGGRVVDPEDGARAGRGEDAMGEQGKLQNTNAPTGGGCARSFWDVRLTKQRTNVTGFDSHESQGGAVANCTY